MDPIPLVITRGPLVDIEADSTGYAVDSNIPALAYRSLAECFAQHLVETIERPTVVFDGVVSGNCNGDVFYSARLSFGGQTSQVALVSARRDRHTNKIIVTDLEPRIEDFRNPGHPTGWEKEFGDPIWRQT